MVLEQLTTVAAGSAPLTLRNVPRPEPKYGQVLIRVTACGVCHTELDEIAGRTPPRQLPIIPGHQIVGIVEKAAENVSSLALGDRVGVAWIYSACGSCTYCATGRENLCAEVMATGRDANGGYAEYLCVPQGSASRIPSTLTDAEAAPLLCAGAVGYRSLQLTGLRSGQRLGLMGFGASAHLVLQIAHHQYPASPVLVFARKAAERQFALSLGAAWAGDINEHPPAPVDCVIDTTPAWRPVLASLGSLARGGRLVINAIRKEDSDRSALLELSYTEHLWQEKEIKSVANVTRRDVAGILALAAEIRLRPIVTEYALEDANRALLEIRQQDIRGAKVLRIS